MIKFVDFNYGKVPDMSERLDMLFDEGWTLQGALSGWSIPVINRLQGNGIINQSPLLIFYKRDKKK